VIALFFALGGAATIAATSICSGNIPCVNSDDIINGEVKTPDVANLGITTAKLADSSVTSAKIANSAVTNAKIGTAAVTNAKIGTAAVTNGKLAANAVTTGKVMDNNLQGADLLDGTVATADLANGAVTPAKVGTIPAARVTKSASQSVGSGALTTLTWDAEDFDTAALHDNAVNNSRLTAPISGIYQVTAGVDWAFNATGFRQAAVSVNGSSHASVIVDPSSSADEHQQVSDIVNLSAGDFVEVQGEQTSGGGLNVLGGGGSFPTFMAMTWIGPG
jgi:hypothetical protein